jgi:hypothetical protein
MHSWAAGASTERQAGHPLLPQHTIKSVITVLHAISILDYILLLLCNAAACDAVYAGIHQHVKHSIASTLVLTRKSQAIHSKRHLECSCSKIRTAQRQ